jgi:putative ABC transport system permease protein
MLLKLSFRNLMRHKARTGMALTAIAFGVIALILMGGFVQDIFSQLRDVTIHGRLGFLQVYRAGYYQHGQRDPFAYMIQNPEQLMQKLGRLPHVTDIMQRVSFSGLLNNGHTDQPVSAQGVEPDKEARLGTYLSIIEGRQLTPEDSYGALLGEGVASALNLHVGDYCTLLSNTTSGAMNSLDVQVIGIFRTYSKDFDARAVRVPLKTARELLDTDSVHALVFSLENAGATEGVAHRVRAALPRNEYEVKTWRDLDDFYVKTVNLYTRQFGVLKAIVMGIVLLSVANSITMATFERVGEFGTLRALGDRGRDIFRLVLTENVLLGLVGALAGVAVGCALAAAISAIGIPMPPPPNSNSGYTAHIQIVPAVVTSAFLIGFLAALLAAVVPARRASRVPIAQALRQNI